MPSRLPLALVAMILATTGCGLGTGREPVLGARLGEDGEDSLVIEFSGCEDSPPIRVDETDDAVRITLDTPRSGCEPLFEATVELEAPLGDRAVVDGATGDVVVPSGG